MAQEFNIHAFMQDKIPAFKAAGMAEWEIDQEISDAIYQKNRLLSPVSTPFDEPDDVGSSVSDFSGVNPIKSNGKFSIKNKSFFLTYPTHIDKNALKQHLGKIVGLVATARPPRIEKFYCAHESSDKAHSYEHCHVVMLLTSAFQSTNCRIFDFTTEDGTVLHPNIQVVKKWMASCTYISKQDEECRKQVEANEKPRAGPVTGQEILDVGDRKKALLQYPVNMAANINVIYDRVEEKVVKTYLLDELLPWQNDLLDLARKSNDRQIIWIYDPAGSSGKSVLCTHLADSGNDWHIVQKFGQGGDLACNLVNAMEGGWNNYGLLIDLSRQGIDHKIYGDLEMLKSSRMTATKYNSKTVRMAQIPHIVVMANWLPKVGEMSSDRWSIHEVVHPTVAPNFRLLETWKPEDRAGLVLKWISPLAARGRRERDLLDRDEPIQLSASASAYANLVLKK